MNNSQGMSVILLGLFLTTISCVQNKVTVTDHLNVGSISFDNVKYDLSWSSHPADNYYKQEYLPGKDSIEKFKK